MSMDLDRSLDDIISQKKKTTPRRSSTRGRGASGAVTRRGTGRKTVTPGVNPARNQLAGNNAAVQNAQIQKKANAVANNGLKIPGVPDGLQGSKIVVSNLPEDVTEPQIRELFTTTIGPIKTAQLTFNSHGRSTGVATVEFKNPADGAKAFHQYNKRLIDQRRPMKVEIVVDPTKAPPAPLTSRIAPPPAAPRVVNQPAKGATKATAAANNASPRTGGRGGRRGRGGRGGGRASRPQVSKEDLDQEMTDWAATNESGKA